MRRLGTLVLVLMSLIGKGNNVSVSNVSMNQFNTTQNHCKIEFDLSWENSWRDATNWDAVWVFVKFLESGGSAPWGHATLNYVDGTSDGHTAPTGTTINTPSDGKGILIYRNATGSGNLGLSNVQIQWNYGSDGLTNASTTSIRVYAIEMVYIPQGSFYVGDGESTDLYGHFESGTSGAAFQITSENSITLGGGGAGSLGNNNRQGQWANGGCASCVDCQSQGCLSGSGDDFDDAASQTLPAAFPKGYDAFYCMKYEVSQQEFVEMLNTVSATQQSLLASTSSFFYSSTLASNRWTIAANAGTYSTSEPSVPMVFFDWIRIAAYADWTGLRPMTELEFEKACRGTGTPVTGEYPWGNANIDLSTNLTLNNFGDADEGVSAGYNSGGTSGNCWVNGGSHSMSVVARVGIFAANASNSGRVTSGASFYGLMEMGGNAWERAVSVGHSEGRKFTGNHGDGNLHSDGYATVTNWPGTFAASEVNTNVGVGYRGAGLAYPSPNVSHNARVSSRRLASGYWNIVIHDDGARLVRTSEW